MIIRAIKNEKKHTENRITKYYKFDDEILMIMISSDYNLDNPSHYISYINEGKVYNYNIIGCYQSNLDLISDEKLREYLKDITFSTLQNIMIAMNEVKVAYRCYWIEDIKECEFLISALKILDIGELV